MYIVSEDAYPAGRFLRPNVLCFCLDPDAVKIEGRPVPGLILGNSFNTLPQRYEKRSGTIVIVQMLSGAWFRLFDIDPARFTTITALDDDYCKGLETLFRQLSSARRDFVRISRLLDSFLLERLALSHPRGLAERFRAEVIEDLDQTIADIASKIGVTERTLQRAVRKVFGVSPARLRRIIRLYRSVDQGRGLEIEWLHVPADLQFADQSHWIKEFRKLQGMTPGEYRQQPLGSWRYYKRGIADPNDPASFGAEPSQEWEEHFASGAPALDLRFQPSSSNIRR
ncbi:helix-turn-helix domain-containing protein [Altererythrobacter aurantiacus]|uniref:Helix-turn-helix domain-containing protein n=1 Tax=Parapontixanthobacter aurantiacus TaxID=1463599 RepID=A0A844ZEZ1_9SPHN|nr:AraC family transcriptional regulator [Parapontixanthobacter aurantiacus]MXO86445.1 helix-turn-helix domain-containing protein [Parapontixanthobacter aurantiacus]